MSDAPFTEALMTRLHKVLGPQDGFVALHEPEFAGREWDMVRECLDTGWVSSVGKYVDRFEADIAAICGTRYGVAVVNGTAALQVALMVCGVEPGDEVLMPSLSFAATAHAALHLGAVPHFVDIARDTLGMDAAALAAHLGAISEMRDGVLVNRMTGRRISAVVPMHCFGTPVDMDGLDAVARTFGLTIVEDAAESLGSTYHGRPCGSFGKAAALSFNGNKILTTGGGGAIVTDDENIANRAKHLTTTAKKPHRWAFEHDAPGFNYRMPNLNAALGCAQLEQLPDRLARKRHLATRYSRTFEGFDGARILPPPTGSNPNCWLNTLVLAPARAHQRDSLLDTLNDAGIMARPAWTPLHCLPYLANAPRSNLEVTEEMASCVINLPSSAKLADMPI